MKKYQSGRSMVEMLGVLAIIGVLSVAGIAGYTTAMNKHRANEILNEASKRAIVVASQIASGRTPTLTEFTDNEVGGATFSQEVKDKDGGDWSASDSQFKIGFDTAPSEDVLAQMKNIAGENGIVRKITDGSLIYNSDLSTEIRSSDFDGDSTKCIGPKYKLCSGSGRCLDADINCSGSCSGIPPTCKSECDETGAWSISSKDEGKDCITTDGKEGMCVAGECEEKSNSPKFVPGILKAYHWSGSANDSLYSTQDIPKEDSILCPNGYHWAEYSDVDSNWDYSKKVAFFTDTELCQTQDGAACSGTSPLLFKNYNGGRSWVTFEIGSYFLEMDFREDLYGYPLCVK